MKKCVSIFLTLVLVFTLSSCQNENAKTADSPATTTPISYHTLPVPEDGWSGEDIAKTFYLYGHRFSKDFTIESLGDDFEIDEENSELDDSGLCSVHLKYNKKSIDGFAITYDGIKSFDEAYDKIPYGLGINVYQHQELYGTETVVFNGIKLGATREEIEAVFGQQTKGDADTMYYADRNKPDKSCLIFLLDDGKLFAFSLVISG